MGAKADIYFSKIESSIQNAERGTRNSKHGTLNSAFSLPLQQQVYGILHGAGFGHSTGVDKVDFVGILDGVQPVGNDNTRGTYRQFRQNFIEQLFGNSIDIGCCFIEYKELWIS